LQWPNYARRKQYRRLSHAGEAALGSGAPRHPCVMCLVRARGVERVEEDVLVVWIDRLTDVLRAAARIG
jgi:hypothetical protein